MTNQTDHFIRDSDNIISLTLTEAGSPIASSPTEITVDIGDGALVVTRTPDGNGISFSGGVLEISPGDLTEAVDIAALVAGMVYPVEILIKTAGDLNGVVFGGADSINKQFFQIHDIPG